MFPQSIYHIKTLGTLWAMILICRRRWRSTSCRYLGHHIFRCAGIIQIGTSRSGSSTATTIGMESGNMASFETGIVKYFVTKLATSHGDIFIMDKSNVFTKTIGQLVFLVAIWAFIHVSFRTMFCQSCRGFKIGFSTNCNKKRITNLKLGQYYSIHYWLCHKTGQKN